MSDPGPFQQTRQEFEECRSYFLPESFSRIEQPKPLFVIGSRGAGKTTFLRALTWSERVENESLQRQLRGRGDESPFAGNYIGVYMKLPKSQMHPFDDWIPEHESQRYSDALALHLGLNWIELIAKAMAELIVRETIDVTPDDEQAVVAQLVREYRSYESFRRHLEDEEVRTLAQLSDGLREVRRELERATQRRRVFEELAEVFPFERLAGFAQRSAAMLAQLLPSDASPPWSFRVCMDEGEAMSPRQQVAMNSIVRMSEAPLYPVVAYISLSAWSNATDTVLTVSRADVDEIALDEMSDSEFRAFVAGVAKVRMQDTMRRAQVRVDLHTILGQLDLNGLLASIAQESVGRRASELVRRAERNRRRLAFVESDAPPIYQTYLIDQLQLSAPTKDDSPKVRRQRSAEIRKRNVAAYLAICQELRTHPLYASAEMVIQMSDKCVRDFLWQMHELWLERGVPAEKFLHSRIGIRTQNTALKRASRQKMERIGGLIHSEPKQAERLIDGLASVTADLQRPGRALRTDRHLRTPELGWWCLPGLTNGSENPSHADPDKLPPAYRLVVDAVEAGYLRLGSMPHRPWRFRVHTSLAAQYGFSYRGAMYDVPLSPEQVVAMCETSGVTERKRLLRGVYRTLRDSDEMTLFGESSEAGS